MLHEHIDECMNKCDYSSQFIPHRQVISIEDLLMGFRMHEKLDFLTVPGQ